MEYGVLGRTGIKVSKLGLGGAPLGGDFGETSDRQVAEVVHAAIDLGINFIDTAPLYGGGESERRIGLALAGGKRHSVVLATKAVIRGEAYNYDNTMRCVEESLRRLRTDTIDLIQLHEAEMTNTEEAMDGVIAAFLKLKEQGKVRAIGVNAGNLELLVPYIQSGLIDTVQAWGRYNLIDSTAKDELFALASEHNIGIINGSVLAMGILADAPAPFLRQQSLLEEAGRRKALLAFLRASEPNGLVEPAMRFSLSCPDIAVTLTGTTSVQSLRMNASYCDGRGLSIEDQEKVLALFAGQKFFRAFGE